MIQAASSRQALTSTTSIVCTPYLPETLVKPEWCARIDRLTNHFPARGIAVFGYECRLGETAEADFLFCLTREGGGPGILSGTDSLDSIPHAKLLGQPEWSALRSFGSAWADDSDAFGRCFDNIWLEFDMCDTDTDRPVPSVFFGPVRDRIGSVEQFKQLVASALHRLGVAAPGSVVERQLFNCCDQLPPAARIFQIGAMLSRENSPLRVCVRDIDANEIISYLTALSWSGSKATLQRLMHESLCYVDSIRLNLDVSETIGRKIGIECYIDPANAETKWPQFLEYLVKSEMCMQAKADGLLEYCGAVSDVTNRDWPEHLSVGAAIGRHQRRSVFVRDFNHFKLVVDGDKPIEAKAYLRVQHHWIKPEDLSEMVKKAAEYNGKDRS